MTRHQNWDQPLNSGRTLMLLILLALCVVSTESGKRWGNPKAPIRLTVAGTGKSVEDGKIKSPNGLNITWTGKSVEYGKTLMTQPDDLYLAKWESRTYKCRRACAANSFDRFYETPIGQRKHMMLFVEAVPYHGSTAIQQVLMSNHNISTLCKAGSWQCEGWKVDGALEDPIKYFKQGNKSNVDDEIFERNFISMFKTWHSLFNLSNPILMEKTPLSIYYIPKSIEIIKDTESGGRDLLVGAMGEFQPVYLFLWRPFCFWRLSSHAREKERAEVIRNELYYLEKTLLAYRSVHDAGFPVLMLSYSDLLFMSDEDFNRHVKSFFPCFKSSNPINRSFVPRKEEDFFDGNRWKVQGSVAEYGDHLRKELKDHPLYDIDKRECNWGMELGKFPEHAKELNEIRHISNELKKASDALCT